MTNKFRALVLSLWLAVSLVVPNRQAYAVAPLLPLAISMATAAGEMLAAESVFAAGTSLIGAMLLVGIVITPGDTSESQLRVPVTSNATAVDAAMPPPSAPPTAAAVQGYTWWGGTTSAQAGCAAYVAYQQEVNPTPGYDKTVTGVSVNGNTAVCNWQVSNGTTTYPQQTGLMGTPVSVCPTGYVSGGGGCVLQNARTAVPDGKADVPRTASGYQAPTSSNDADTMPSYAQVNNGTVYAAGRNSAGQPVMIQYSVSPDGTRTYITHYTQSESGGQSVVNTRSLAVDSASGQVLSANSANAQGSISAPGTGALPTVSTGAAVTPGTATDIVFPTDYARTGEAAAAAGSINARIDANAQTVKDAIEAQSDISSASLDDPLAPTDQELKDVMFKDTFTPLLSWSIPAHSSQCPTADLSFTMFGHYTPLILDAHCTIFEMPNVKSVLSVVMDVVWSVVALFILLGA